MWWGNADLRRGNKEDIKNIIKQKKLAEKAAVPATASSTPSLTHSVPTSYGGDAMSDRNRSSSIDSHFSTGFNFNTAPNPGAMYGPYGGGPGSVPFHPGFLMGGHAPFEVDVKTERQMFVDDVPTLKESHVSTFSTFHTPPPPGAALPCNDEAWAEHIHHERRESSLSEEALNVNFFDFAHGGHADAQQQQQFQVELEDNDQRLLDHFIQYVLPSIFPILEANQHGSVGSDLVLPALQSNKVYLHCCLSVAAEHLKGRVGAVSEELDQDIMRHRYATIWSLCESLRRDENHQQTLEATLALMVFQSVAGRSDDDLLNIPWHQHFAAAANLVQRLCLPQAVLDPGAQAAPAPFNMTLTAWIDILGASMQGVSPTFAHAYREKHLSPVNPNMGLRELMGCDDRVMYLVSEIACLEALKRSGMVDDLALCSHVSVLGEQLTLTEAGDAASATPRLPFNANGSLSPRQLSRNMTTAFRVAARIYLCGLVPGFSPNQHSPVSLVDKLVDVLQTIPSGPHGFDRSMVWVYLMGGAVSVPGSRFRSFFDDRVAQLGDQAACGAFGRMTCVLRETWLRNDALHPGPAPTPGSDGTETDAAAHVHWREVMESKGWDFLMI